MKVYVAERVYDGDGFFIIGVFSTKEKAQAECDADDSACDSYDIEEFEIDAQ